MFDIPNKEEIKVWIEECEIADEFEKGHPLILFLTELSRFLWIKQRPQWTCIHCGNRNVRCHPNDSYRCLKCHKTTTVKELKEAYKHLLELEEFL